jgi:glycosyltransferase involved in cell wall biosynthesis
MKMGQLPLVSVIIPAFNAEAFIGQAIASVLAQDYYPLEVVVVDDGSTDRTAELACGFGDPVRCIRQENAGAPAARNRGFAACTGDLIAFLDADDIFEPGCLHLQRAKLAANPAVDLAVGRLIRENVNVTSSGSITYTPHPQQDEIVLSLGASLIRRIAFDRIGPFDETLRHCDDWDWFMRVRERGVAMLLHREPVLRGRLHAANMTRDRTQGQRHMARMFQLSIHRRRQVFGNARSLPGLSASFEPGLTADDTQ